MQKFAISLPVGVWPFSAAAPSQSRIDALFIVRTRHVSANEEDHLRFA